MLYIDVSLKNTYVNEIMKKVIAILLGALFITSSHGESTFSAEITDENWGGKRIPRDHVCKRFGGKDAHSPQIRVIGIPQEATAILLSFNDETYGPMNRGGHGMLIFDHQGASAALVPSIPAETSEIPELFTAFKDHRGSSWSRTKGAYLPPCSGGSNNFYSVEISAVIMGGDKRTITKTISTVKVVMGRY